MDIKDRIFLDILQRLEKSKKCFILFFFFFVRANLKSIHDFFRTIQIFFVSRINQSSVPIFCKDKGPPNMDFLFKSSNIDSLQTWIFSNANKLWFSFKAFSRAQIVSSLGFSMNRQSSKLCVFHGLTNYTHQDFSRTIPIFSMAITSSKGRYFQVSKTWMIPKAICVESPK